MNKDLKEYRDNVLTHLVYIKEKVDNNYNQLQSINGRVRKTENWIYWIFGIGSAITFILSTIIYIR